MSPPKKDKLEEAIYKEYGVLGKTTRFTQRFHMLTLQQDIERKKENIDFCKKLETERGETWTEETKALNREIITLEEKNLKTLLRKASEA